MPTAETGIQIAADFYRQVVAPALAGLPHSAALLGDGSEVLGYDDAVSTDHDFGPRVQVFVASEPDIPPARARLTSSHGVLLTTAGRFFTERIGADPGRGMALADWLCTPTQVFATLTAGAVFADPDGLLAARRDALRWYPDDVWRYALAAGWLRIDQEEPFVGRTGSTGDDLGSRILAARLVRDLMRVAFLIERRWAPYGKWFGRAFGELVLAHRAGPLLAAALAADAWRDREAALVEAGGILIAATNDLGLAGPVDPAPRRFHDRDIRVVDAGRVTLALTAAITDPDVVRVVAAQGPRPGRDLGRLAGTVDQAVDCTDILCDHARRRAVTPALLGLA